MTPRFLRPLLAFSCLVVFSGVASAQFSRSATTPRPPPGRLGGVPAPNRMPPPPPGTPMRKASELITRQPPISINKGIYDSVTPDNARVIVNLTRQRAYLLNGDQIAIDSPISSGKRAGMTPTGHFNVMEKDRDHRSSIYGDFVDRSGRVVRAGISLKIDSAPSGTRYVGAPMKWFMRLTGDGVGMHVGILPGYPASHGCIRMPEQGAAMFYAKVKMGTPVEVVRDSAP